MNELLNFAISGANVIPTLLLIGIVLYWCTLLIGAIDLDLFDIDLETDADGPATEGHSEVGFEWLNNVLRFFNLGRIPLMVFLSFLILPLWLFCIAVNDMLGIQSLLPGLLTLAAGFFVSLFIAKILTIPFVKLFDKMEEDKNFSVIGRICTLQSNLTEGRIGQATVLQEGNGAPIILMVSSKAGTSVKNGETALVLEYQSDKRCYLIEPYIL